MAGGRPLKFQSVEELQVKIDEYFESCFEEQWIKDADGNWKPLTDKDGNILKKRVRPWTISGLAVHIGTSRDALLRYEDKPEFHDTIKGAKQKVQSFVEESLWTSGITSGVIFNLKNNFSGWVDRQEIDQNIKASVSFEDELEKLVDEDD